ncbi:MAG: hypothetical protein KJP04_08545 [Arenicella sp.]|nr:hypothetical protein [Arenicella sp.]
MSAFLFYLNHSNEPVDPPTVKRMFKQLDHYGLDDQQLHIKENFAIGHQHFWTVPEEQGERQPLYDAENQSWLIFHGRIDNRAALFAELNLAETDSLSDAGLLMRYLLEFADSRLANIVGPFVFVYFNAATGELLAARDAMGGRYLVFHQQEEFMLISTHEIAISAHPQVGLKLNDEKRIRFLCHLTENQPSSLLQGSTPLFPGQKLIVRSGRAELETFYLPDSRSKISLADDEAYALEFRRLLIQAVKRRMRSISPVGCMLSGGLDSAPIAIAAAQLSAQKGDKISAFSWVFDRCPQDDERRYSAPLCEQHGITQHCINCDEVWPMFDAGTYVNPAIPYAFPFSAFNQQLMRVAQQNGVTTLLSGLAGDILYTETSGLFWCLLLKGRFSAAWQELRYLRGIPTSWIGILKKHLIAPLPLIRNSLALRRVRHQAKVDYLTESAQLKLRAPKHWLHKQLRSARRPQQYLNVVDSFEGDDMHYGRHMEAKYGLQRRYPLRDRDLVEFMLSVPVDQLRLISDLRPIVKRAFADELSDDLLKRNSKTEFRTVMAAGLSKDSNYQRWFDQPDASWQSDVKRCHFSQQTGKNIAADTLKWSCAYHEYWLSVCYNPLAIELGLRDEAAKNAN